MSSANFGNWPVPSIALSRTITGPLTSVRPFSDVCVSNMNCASARCVRAIAPDRITKREPESLAAVSKSMPRVTDLMSKCSTASKSNVGGVPHLRISTLSFSSAPCGTSAYGRFGMVSNRSVSLASMPFASSSNAATSAFLSDTRARRRSNSASSPDALTAPTSFDAALRSANAASAAVIFARRSASIAKMADDIGSFPRRANAASKSEGLSRIARMSCMLCLFLYLYRLMHQNFDKVKRVFPTGEEFQEDRSGNQDLQQCS